MTTSCLASPGVGADRRPHVGVLLPHAGHRLGERERVLLHLHREVARPSGHRREPTGGPSRSAPRAAAGRAGWPGGTRAPAPASRPAVASTATTTPSCTRPGCPGRCTTTGQAARRTTPTPTEPSRWLSTRTATAGAEHHQVSALGSAQDQRPWVGDLEPAPRPPRRGRRRAPGSCAGRAALAVQALGGEGPGLARPSRASLRPVVTGRRRAHERGPTPLEGRLLGGPPDRLAGQGHLVDADDDAAALQGVHLRLLTSAGGRPLTARLRPAVAGGQGRKGASARDQRPADPSPAALTPPPTDATWTA